MFLRHTAASYIANPVAERQQVVEKNANTEQKKQQKLVLASKKSRWRSLAKLMFQVDLEN